MTTRNASFPRLFETVTIGKMVLKNRIVMPAMGTGFTTKDGLMTEQAVNYYSTRAKGGAGMIIVECACVDYPRGLHASSRLSIGSDSTIAGLTRLAQSIKENDARAIIQLHHAGRFAKSKVTGYQPVAPSPIATPSGSHPQGEIPKELTTEEISEISGLFAQAAARAKQAGFDGIEIHAGHGYLIAQFLSPLSNIRHDMYGGSIENRARMLMEVLHAIRASVGEDYPLWCRVNGREFGKEGGYTLDDARALARMMDGIVDAIHVSCWGHGRSSLANFPDNPGELLPLAQEIKRVVKVPVIAVGRLTPELGEQAIRDGKADLVAFGRRLIADPDLPNKVLSGKSEDIRPCIACFYCNDVGLMKDSPIACAVNTAVGKEGEFRIRPAKPIKKIAVIGGGPAGMETARMLTLRGHKVVLFEKEPRLGGQMALAAMLPHKERIGPLLTYFETQLRKLGVEVLLKAEARPEDIEAIRPDAVVLATGARPVIPRIPGVHRHNVVTAVDVITGRARVGRKVVILGGGSTGCEIAEFLMGKTDEITIVEKLGELAVGMGFRDRVRLMNRINALPINIATNTTCSGIETETVRIITPESKERVLAANTVVLAVGAEPNETLSSLLRSRGFETYLAGDCYHGRQIADAISDGVRLGCTL